VVSEKHKKIVDENDDEYDDDDDDDEDEDDDDDDDEDSRVREKTDMGQSGVSRVHESHRDFDLGGAEAGDVVGVNEGQLEEEASHNIASHQEDGNSDAKYFQRTVGRAVELVMKEMSRRDKLMTAKVASVSSPHIHQREQGFCVSMCDDDVCV